MGYKYAVSCSGWVTDKSTHNCEVILLSLLSTKAPRAAKEASIACFKLKTQRHETCPLQTYPSPEASPISALETYLCDFCSQVIWGVARFYLYDSRYLRRRSCSHHCILSPLCCSHGPLIWHTCLQPWQLHNTQFMVCLHECFLCQTQQVFSARVTLCRWVRFA